MCRKLRLPFSSVIIAFLIEDVFFPRLSRMVNLLKNREMCVCVYIRSALVFIGTKNGSVTLDESHRAMAVNLNGACRRVHN